MKNFALKKGKELADKLLKDWRIEILTLMDKIRLQEQQLKDLGIRSLQEEKQNKDSNANRVSQAAKAVSAGSLASSDVGEQMNAGVLGNMR